MKQLIILLTSYETFLDYLHYLPLYILIVAAQNFKLKRYFPFYSVIPPRELREISLHDCSSYIFAGNFYYTIKTTLFTSKNSSSDYHIAQ